MAVFLSLAAALSWGTTELLMIRAAKVLPILFLARWLMVVGAVMIVPIALATDPVPSLRDLPYALAPALFAIGGTSAYFLALRAGQLSIVSPTVATSGGVAAVMAILVLGERFPPLGLLGIALAVAGVVLATFVRGGGTAQGIGWALLAAVLLAIYTVTLAGSTARIGPLWSVAMYRITGALILFPIGLIFEDHLPMSAPALGRVFRAALIETVGFITFTTALDLGPVAIVAVITAQFSTVAVVLAGVVLHERLRVHQWLGVGMMIASTTILAAVQ
jgi:drug/metabolite transporter (DMT)-like permease